MSKQKTGFTIIETMLFLAISGLVFAGVVIGTNGSLRSQRYRDTVQSFVNSLRDVYSKAENTEIAAYGNGQITCGNYNDKHSETKDGMSRGRSNCAVYGMVAAIYSRGDEAVVYSSLLGGLDDAEVENNSKATGLDSHSDFNYLKLAGVSEYFSDNNGGSWSKKGVTEAKLLWGAKVRVLCEDLGSYAYSDEIPDCKSGKKTTDDVGVALVVYKSPNSGSLKTFTRYALSERLYDSVSNGANPKDDEERPSNFEDDSMGELTTFKHEDVSFCIEAGEGMRSDGGMRMVMVDGNGTGENAIRLIEADSTENRCN